MNTNSLVMWETLQNNADWDCFKTPILQLEDSKSTSGGTLCVFGSHTFVPVSWMCKKQTSVSHSSPEAEIISLDAGLLMDGIPKKIVKAKHKWSHEKPKLDNSRKLRGIYFIDFEDKEFKETIKNARKKLETPMAPAMLCKTSKKSKHGKTRGKTNEFKSKLACILEASESTRLRVEESLPNYHEDHIAGRGDNSLQHYNLVHKFIPMPQAMKIPAPKAAVNKEWEKLEKIPARDLTRVRSNKEVIDEARTKGAKVHFASLMDICHLKNAELEAKHHIFKRSARRCPPRHSRRSAKRAMEQWVLHSQGTIAFCLHTLRKTVLFHAVVCLMFPVFWPWHCVFHAPVCYCHRDSLTRWRLALVQEAARVASSLSSHLFFEARCAL